MVQTKNKSIDFAKKFKKNINNSINIDKLILFGSRAKGTFKEDSDFDFILVSDDFKKVPRHKRAIPLYNKWNYMYPADFLCYTREEYLKKKNSATIVREAEEEGIVI